MKDPEIIVGLDIGTTKICAIVGEKTENGKINILGIGREDSHDAVLRGVVTNIDRTVEAIRMAVDTASATSGVNIEVVHVGIAGQHIRSLHNRGLLTRDNSQDEIRQEDLDRLESDMHKIVLDPGEKIIHVIAQDYIVDNERGIRHPIGMAGVRLEGNFHIITGQIGAARNIERCVQKAGLKLADLILEPIASSMAVLSEEEMEAGVTLVDIGGGTTDIAIFKDGILRHTAVIPLGGEIITHDIKEGCNVLYKHAEKLKIEHGSALASETDDAKIVVPGLKGREPKELSRKNLAHIIQARAEEIFEHVYFEIRSPGFDKKLGGGIVLTGGGSQLKHLPQLVEYRTGIDTRVGFPNEHLAKGLVQEVGVPMYATGIGLVLYGLNAPSKTDGTNEKKALQEKKRNSGGFLQRAMDWLKDDQNDFKN